MNRGIQAIGWWRLLWLGPVSVIAVANFSGCDRIAPIPLPEIEATQSGQQSVEKSASDVATSDDDRVGHAPPQRPAMDVGSQSNGAPTYGEPQGALLQRIDRVLANGLSERRLSSEENAAWQIMHGVICYGHDLPLQTPDLGLVPALDYAFHGGMIRGWQLKPGDILPSGRRGVKALLEPGSYTGQGHVDQWIAICAMADLPQSDKVVLEGETMTLRDWAEQARWDACTNPLNEASWTLIALTHYFPEDAQWTASDGSTWSWERMVADEVRYDLTLSPCGGSHRLVGLARALEAKQRLKLADSQIWDEARRIVERSVSDIQDMRSGDGSLSSHYLERPGSSRDLGLTLASTGHLLEFLAVGLPTRDLKQPWVAAAAARLCEIFEATRTADLDCGACYHGLNGLRVYRARLART